MLGDVLLYPRLGEPLQRSTDKALTFFIAITPAPRGVPEASVAILSDGQPVARGPLPLASRAGSGRIDHVAQVPVDTLTPGRYTLRVIVSQGASREVRDTQFEVRE